MTISAFLLYTSISFGTALSLVILEELSVNRVEDSPILDKLAGKKQRHHSSSFETSGGE